MAEHERPFGHEPPAIATRRVLATGGVLALIVIGVVIVLHFALRNAVMPYHAQVVVRPAPIPPPPRLQPSPEEDLARFRGEKQALLSYYAWTDAVHHYAHIPLSRAMEIYAQQRAAQPKASSVPAAASSGAQP
ncbi:MAG TPA: hypothetical protein VN725_02770 [Rhodanobacteraceae bacterium]|nr:hypothetical protein [Rhodanobacteraceae bacterium]